MITVEFKDFNEMIAFAKQLLSNQIRQEERTPDTKKETKTAEPASDFINPPKEPMEEESAKTYTLEEVRAKLAELTRSGKAKGVKELLNSFGAKNLTSLDPKHYAAVMEKAGAL